VSEYPSQAVVQRLTADVPNGSGTLYTIAPFTGRLLAELPASSVDDVAQAYAVARKAQNSWASRSVDERSRLLLRAHDLFLRHRDELCDLIQLESGKARLDAFGEVAAVALSARYYGRVAPRLLKRKRRVAPVPGAAVARELRHPVGVVGIVSPWDYPLVLGVTDTLPALVAGNAVVHKPDPQGALTTLRARELLLDAGLPSDAWQIVLGDGPTVGAAVVDYADFVSFTGSSATGRIVGRQAGDRLVGATLELGGKNPAIVLADADPDKAADVLVRACFTAAGQACVSIERIYVAAPVYDTFVERFVRRIVQLRLGVGVRWGYDVGSLVTAEHRDRVLRHIEDAKARGARLVVGGRLRTDIGPYVVEPTVFEGLHPGMLAYDEETFGPVIGITRVGSEAEAIAAANDSPYGLLGVVLSGSLRHGMAVAERLHCGAVAVNESFHIAWATMDAPLGGIGISGVGRRHGPEGLLRFTQAKAVARQRVRVVTAPVAGLTDEQFARVQTVLLRVVKASGRR
jgi:succinate-semialdehyde dehydrogenase / glutarate-semialdehyde dehydrogenase